MSNALPKVLIFTITYEGKDYCFKKWKSYVKKINYPNYRHIIIDNSATTLYTHKLRSKGFGVFHVGRGNNTRESMARSQNLARKIAVDEGYDYLLSLESDVMVPPDIIQRLMTNGRPVVTGLYFIGDINKNERVPCICVPDDKGDGIVGTRLLTPEEWPQYFHHGLMRVHTGSFGCCLIHRDVFSLIPFKYEPGLRHHPDVFFFNDCMKNRIPVFVDTDIVLDHDNVPWSLIKDR
jgi:hypothetical protein